MVISAREIFPTLAPEDAQSRAARADLLLRLEAAIDEALRGKIPRGAVDRTYKDRITVTLSLPQDFDSDWLKLVSDLEAWNELVRRLLRSGWDLNGDRQSKVAKVVLSTNAPAFSDVVEERARAARLG